MTARKEYQAFLRDKIKLASGSGFTVDPSELNPLLQPFTRASAQWMLEGGQRALFSKFGLHKTVTQLDVMRLLGIKRPGAPRLIVAPLQVRQEFLDDAAQFFRGEFAIDLRFVQSTHQIDDERPIWLTNYEPVRDGKLDPKGFRVSLDEASILRGFGGTKTFREFMRLFEHSEQERFVATATPSPNEYIELLAYAAFLGIMDVGQAKTRFFKRNSEKADDLTLRPGAEREFWMWVGSWSLWISKPSDLGFSDDGYTLPELDVRLHEVPTDHAGAGAERDGQARMFRNAGLGVVDASREKRDSLPARVAKLQEIRAEDPAAHRVIWHDLEAERAAIEKAIPARFDHWVEVKDGHPKALEIYDRHYSARKMPEGEARKLLLGPGDKMVLLTEKHDALLAWRKFIDDTQPKQEGVCCSVFRSEGVEQQSSDLIKEAMAIAWQRWPSERLYTLVNAKKVQSENPGYCFEMAGWRRVGKTKGGLIIWEARPEWAEVPAVVRRPGVVSVYGKQDDDERDQAIAGFKAGTIAELAAKPVMLGSGCNFQKHCSWGVYLGIGFKFNDFIQSVHRLQRFGQPGKVRIDLIYTSAEREVLQRLQRRWKQHDEQTRIMSELIREFGLSQAAMAGELQRSIGISREEAAGNGWTMVLNDCVDEVARMKANSVDLVVTSIPFGTQYEYSPSYNDFGHTDDDRHFFEQMDFLLPNLLRTLKPGRIAAIHVKDRIIPGGMTGLGFSTVSAFSDKTREAFERHGFAFLSRIVIPTDVVRENSQTYRLGWSEQCKDGTRMGNGMPEYLLIFRKPQTDRSKGYADQPVTKPKPLTYQAGSDGPAEAFVRGKRTVPDTGYSRGRWQLDAHGFRPTDGEGLHRLLPKELADVIRAVRADPDQKKSPIFRVWKKWSLEHRYSFDLHVAFAEELDRYGLLPPDFMLIPPHSDHPEIWTDIARMRSLNMIQQRKGLEQHLCPLPFDIVDRAIVQYSAPGELVLDMFGGIGTVGYCAKKLKRRAYLVELSRTYWSDGVAHLQELDRDVGTLSLFGDLPSADSKEAA